MHKRFFPLQKSLEFTKILSFVVLGHLAGTALASETPNIIIFYVDDLGWQDVQLNELDEPCPYETPNLIKLAKSGMNFTQAYSPAPTCSPSRAGIITGQHPAKIKMTHVDLGSIKVGKSSDLLVAPYLEGLLDRDLLTLADAMKANGYHTGHSGKWHVGLSATNYGFDVVNQDRGVHRGMNDRTKDFATANDSKYPLSKEKYPPISEKTPDGISYPYDEVTESALKFMAESKERPFFLNLCHWMVHWPMLTRNGELLEYYCNKFEQPFPPKPGAISLPGQQNPYFASMVTTVDWSLGRVVDFLEKTDDPRNPGKKLVETTYIFFTSDNGGAERRGKEILSDNAPLKLGKKFSEEGGIRVPMVITGPKVQKNSHFDGLVNQLDYFPTILTMTDSKIAQDDFDKLSGLDLLPVLSGKSQQVIDGKGHERDHLFWHFPHNGAPAMKSAIRSGDFKLYKRYATDNFELYRLYEDGKRKDLEEQNNLAENPEFTPIVKRLWSTLKAELIANHAEGPYLNPLYAKKDKPVATLAHSIVQQPGRKAQLNTLPSGPKLKEAYVIYREDPTSKKKKKSRHTLIKETAKILPGMREPVPISADGRSISATIPENISAFCFMLIDENNFLQYSEIVSVENLLKK